MSISISSSVPITSLAAGNATTNSVAAQNTQPVQQTTARPADTVTLTLAQQVYQLYNQGQRVSQIATSLRLPVETVNNYLGITTKG
jgi:DNA-binding NarL/FixJ family response regulator